MIVNSYYMLNPACSPVQNNIYRNCNQSIKNKSFEKKSGEIYAG